MSIEHIDLLQIQRDLHDIPSGTERFQTYLQTLLNDTGDDIQLLPLAMMNPMGREHMVECLDELLLLDGDAIAAEAVAEASARLGDIAESVKHGLVLLDDIAGGWTNRITTDASFRFNTGLSQQRPWITTWLWASDPPSRQQIWEVVLASVFRAAYIQQQGTAKTLRQMMAQEGAAAAFAGQTPQMNQEELEYSRHAIAPHLDTTAYPICIAALYGDHAAHSLGYTPLELSENAGFEVALADAQRAED